MNRIRAVICRQLSTLPRTVAAGAVSYLLFRTESNTGSWGRGGRRTTAVTVPPSRKIGLIAKGKVVSHTPAPASSVCRCSLVFLWDTQGRGGQARQLYTLGVAVVPNCICMLARGGGGGRICNFKFKAGQTEIFLDLPLCIHARTHARTHTHTHTQ